MIDKDWEEKLILNTVSHGTGFMRMSLNKSGGIDVDIVDPKDYRFCIKEPQVQVSFNSEVLGYVEPQREWVGLTDEEIAEVAEQMEASDPTDSFWRNFSQSIEAKLKEKNT